MCVCVCGGGGGGGGGGDKLVKVKKRVETVRVSKEQGEEGRVLHF